MKAPGKKSLLLAAGIAAVAAAAVSREALTTHRADPVVESPARVQNAQAALVPFAPAPAPAVSVDYLQPLPDPPAPEKAQAQRPASSFVPLPSPAAPLADPIRSVSQGGECAIGTRPMGGCNCFDESAGKLSLRNHPSQECVNEEAKRLGHAVVLGTGEGRYELAGEAPKPETAGLPPASQAALQAAFGALAMAEKMKALQLGGYRAPSGQFSHSVQMSHGMDRTIILGDQGVLYLQGRPPKPFASGTCPPGTKNEGCRCMDATHTVVTPVANPPALCNDPDIQRALHSDVESYRKAWWNRIDKD